MDKKQIIRMSSFLFWNFLASLLVEERIMAAIDGSSKYSALKLVVSLMIYMIVTVSMAERFVGHALIDVAESRKLPKVKITVKKSQED